MPNTKVAPKLRINLDLLRPQSNPEKLPAKFLHWLLSTGRFIFIFVEGLVLIAFIARFKLDADLTNLNESIDEQIPYVESLKAFEVRIRQTQLKLTTIGNIDASVPDYALAIKKIAAQTPQSAQVNSLSLDKDVGKITIQINGQTQNNYDISSFLNGIKSDNYFSNVNLSSISFTQGVIKFSITANGVITQQGTNL